MASEKKLSELQKAIIELRKISKEFEKGILKPKTYYIVYCIEDGDVQIKTFESKLMAMEFLSANEKWNVLLITNSEKEKNIIVN